MSSAYTPRLRAVLGTEHSARAFMQAEKVELPAIAVSTQAITLGNRQTGVAQQRKVGGLRSEAARVHGLRSRDGNNEFAHADDSILENRQGG